MGRQAEPMAWLVTLAHLTIALPWLGMIVWPNHGVTRRLVGSNVFVGFLCLVYGLLFLALAPRVVPVLLNPQLPAIAQLLGEPTGAALGWIHFLAIDLFVGRQMYLETSRRGPISWASRAVFLLTLMAAPLGLGTYMVQRHWWKNREGFTAA